MAVSQHVVVVIREDPTASPRAVEALRIALGLAAGDARITVVLLDRAVQLLATDRDEIEDVETLEKYLPSFAHLEIPFVVPSGTASSVELEPDYQVTEATPETIRSLSRTADRVMVF
ncbi:MAG: DsrE family protein [Nitrospiraceae bacterium]